VSNRGIQEEIREMIGEENKQSPSPIRKSRAYLEQRGMSVARRTVANTANFKRIAGVFKEGIDRDRARKRGRQPAGSFCSTHKLANLKLPNSLTAIAFLA